MEILLFDVAGERCALPLADVLRVVPAAAVAPLPGAPPVVEGVLDLRGRVVPVLSLRRRFALPDRPLRPDEVFVVVAVGGRVVALRADAALGIARVEDGDVVPAARVVARPGHVGGVARLPDGLALIHDLGTFLSEAEAAGVDAALAAAGRGA
ncbi:MAG TPA: chemotaxis protein CheW [Longimicrobiaceae bacterium]|jgi:purine-binding chemotaxis protein CheW